MARPGFQIEDDAVISCNGIGFRSLLQAGYDWLEVHLKIVNDLNVFPVPDGDTGINMLLTVRAALEHLAPFADERHLGAVMAAAAEGALLGGRGNSGVILSQFFKGMAQSLGGESVLTGQSLASAAQAGVDLAYQGVFEPVEGTILTVMCASAQAAQTQAVRGEPFEVVLAEMVVAAQQAQLTTPDLLPVLKAAGVTDSGGQGFVYILEGALRFLQGQSLAADGSVKTEAGPNVAALTAPETGYGYDVQFLIQGEQLNLDTIRAKINELGQSTLVAGDGHLVKIHIHTPDPGKLLSFGVSQGAIRNVVVENLQIQAEAFVAAQSREQPLAVEKSVNEANDLAGPLEFVEGIGVVAIASGPGFARIFKSLGASQVVTSHVKFRANMQDLLHTIRQIGTQEIIVLPNSGSVLLAAQQIEAVTHQKVEIIPTHNMPQGIAALLAFNPAESLATNAERMKQALHTVQTIELAQVSLNSACVGSDFRWGDIVGMIEGRVVAQGKDYEQVICDILATQAMDTIEIVALYFGEAMTKDEAEILGEQIKGYYPVVEIEIHEGGQSHHDYIIVLE